MQIFTIAIDNYKKNETHIIIVYRPLKKRIQNNHNNSIVNPKQGRV